MKRTCLLAVLFGATALIGCAGPRYAYIAPAPPPAVRVEAYGVAPGPGFVWIQGYWAFRAGGYAWVPGYWARRPHPRAAWVPGYWEQHGRQYRYRNGHWR